MFSTNRLIHTVLKFFTVFIVVFLALGAFAAPAGILDENHASVRAVMAVQGQVTPNLMRQPEILGTAVGVDAAGTPVLTVYVDRDSANAGEVIRNLPREFRGVGVQVHLTDEFHAMLSTVSHTAKQTPPIQLGTSGGFSNYHVFESDIVAGGNNTVATTGDPIIQPGLIDVNCSVNGAQSVATLVKKSSLPSSNVDCSVGKVVAGRVQTDGSILEIGTISHLTTSAAINQAVKKSGRTTGLSRSSVSGLNATVSVTYGNECAGGTAFTKTFTGQIVIANSGSKFLNSGDSGSLMVEDVATNPRAVGLLFAGSSTSAIANPIGHVLSFLSATMVGN